LRALITGASGFAGSYLVRACLDAGDEVIAVSRGHSHSSDRGEHRRVDLRDQAAVRSVLRDCEPEVIYHLAALSSVGRSWEDAGLTVQDNVSTALSMLEAWRLDAPRARMVWVSSCEVYGSAAKLPIDEDAPAEPANPYAVSKLTGELLAGVYADAHRLELVRVRPFNHAGPGQRPVFILSSLARQAAEGRIDGAQRIRVATGNPDTRRDFTDVRDVVRAYRLLAERARPGIYNVCSGRSISAAEQIRVLADVVAPLEITHEVDPARVRAHEVMDLRGSNARIREAVGWWPEIPFEDTMRDTVAWWEQALAPAPDGAARR
jgi:GDP-4-dehydro-6-deoxy-D-mannose reductase